MERNNLVGALGEQARSLGFRLFGVAPARPSPHLDAYLRWIEAGMHGEMTYLAREDRLARRRDLTRILPDARSVVTVGLNYPPATAAPTPVNDPTHGRISNYAWGADYHDVMLARLNELGDTLARGSASWRAYVDTGAILERSHAADAGLGFIGKNTLLIHPRYGSYLFLGELLTDLALPPTPLPRMPDCGSCTRCLDACPTGALVEPYVLDARRCISYLTIELKGWIPHDLRPLMGNWIYGCDICQQVCPWQRFARPTDEAAFRPIDQDRTALPLADVLAMDEAAFSARYKGMTIHRIRRERLVRNACVAAGNSGLPEISNCLVPLLNDPSPLVRGHAAWALGQLGAAEDALRRALANESDKAVRQELQNALAAQ
jgi:epoxyqueuosine reductase